MPAAWSGKKIAALLRRLRKCGHSRCLTLSNVVRQRNCMLILLVITFLTIILFIATRTPTMNFTHSRNQRESENTTMLLHDEDFLGVEGPQVVHISHVFVKTNEIFTEADLDNGLKALIHILSLYEMDEELFPYPDQLSSPLSASSRRIPSLDSVSSALHMSGIVAPSFVIRLPLPLQPSVAKRSTTHALYKALGFSSRLQIPQHFSAVAVVYPARLLGDPAPMTKSILTTPAVEPYLWRIALPTATECAHTIREGRKTGIADDFKMRDACLRVCDTMLIAYIGGCGPPGDPHFVAENNSAEIRLGRPFGCFHSSKTSRIADATRDIWRIYVIATCRVSRDLVNSLSTLRNLSWGVGERSADAYIWLTRNGVDLLRKSCGHTNWIP